MLMCEIATGKRPWAELDPDGDGLSHDPGVHVLEGKLPHLTRNGIQPPEAYSNLMAECCSLDELKRPKFSDVSLSWLLCMHISS